jgi:hypothetical protein
MSRHIPHRPRTLMQAASLVLASLASAGALMAQAGSQGTLLGTIKDSTGAIVLHAKVTVVNTATQFVSETITSEEGNYNFPYRPEGLSTSPDTRVSPGLQVSSRSANAPSISISFVRVVE